MVSLLEAVVRTKAYSVFPREVFKVVEVSCRNTRDECFVTVKRLRDGKVLEFVYLVGEGVFKRRSSSL